MSSSLSRRTLNSILFLPYFEMGRLKIAAVSLVAIQHKELYLFCLPPTNVVNYTAMST